ncbi:hypothetical protein BDY19DRAFT_903503 [Irpex rosettiformis]|uniref:Uncharacterized protein n=1 Tax=Irpex rosettiformis TaxID=378272 RepID=A0ACB8UEL2_9APHY|nr:hypothetical protein BDY19DRAFT_903503 [Irpex rosettiformis]
MPLLPPDPRSLPHDTPVLGNVRRGACLMIKEVDPGCEVSLDLLHWRTADSGKLWNCGDNETGLSSFRRSLRRAFCSFAFSNRLRRQERTWLPSRLRMQVRYTSITDTRLLNDIVTGFPVSAKETCVQTRRDFPGGTTTLKAVILPDKLLRSITGEYKCSLGHRRQLIIRMRRGKHILAIQLVVTAGSHTRDCLTNSREKEQFKTFGRIGSSNSKLIGWSEAAHATPVALVLGRSRELNAFGGERKKKGSGNGKSYAHPQKDRNIKTGN